MHQLMSGVVHNLFNKCKAGIGSLPDQTLLVLHESGAQYLHLPALNANLSLLGDLLAQLHQSLHSGHGCTLNRAHRNSLNEQWGTYEDAKHLMILGLGAGAVEVQTLKTYYMNMHGETSHSDVAHYRVKDYVFTDTEGILRNSDGTLVEGPCSS